MPGLQTPSLGGRATGLPCVARAKEGQRIVTIFTRFGIDLRTQCNLKTKGCVTEQLRFEHTIEGEWPPRAVLAQKREGSASHPSPRQFLQGTASSFVPAAELGLHYCIWLESLGLR